MVSGRWPTSSATRPARSPPSCCAPPAERRWRGSFPGLIALLGATGFTGRLVAAELARRGIDHRRGARDPEKLAALAPDPTGEPFVVDAGERARLDAFLDGAEAVINTVGPFSRLGMPVVEAAVENGVAYVDSTGEFESMADVCLRFRGASGGVVPACGCDYSRGDLAASSAAAALQAEGPGDPSADVTVSCGVSGGL